MQSKATNVADYLAGLPSERREALEALRQIMLKHLPQGFAEVMNWGMITYEVPLAIEPKTNNGQPLMYAALANQKNYMAVYICSLSCVPGGTEKFTEAWSAKKLDMGKSCIRFKKLEDLDLALIGKTIAATSVAEYVTAFKLRYARKSDKP